MGFFLTPTDCDGRLVDDMNPSVRISSKHCHTRPSRDERDRAANPRHLPQTHEGLYPDLLSQRKEEEDTEEKEKALVPQASNMHTLTP